LKVSIRVDASARIGAGHLMRCLCLAEVLSRQGAEIEFLCGDHSDELATTLIGNKFPLVLLKRPNGHYMAKPDDPACAESLGASWEYDVQIVQSFLTNTDCLIIDHYGLDYRWHRAMRGHVDKIVAIDDWADRKHDCDLLLDQTFDRDIDGYQGLVPENAQLLLGSNYALLRPEFLANRAGSLERRMKHKSIQRILVYLGGIQSSNGIGTILDGLGMVAFEDLPEIDIVLNTQSSFIEEIRKRVGELPFEVNIHTHVSDMARFMFQADLAIGAGGSTSWERCCLGLPSLICEVADNQKYVISNLVATGAVISLGDIDKLLPAIVKNAVIPFIGDSSKLQAMVESSSSVCDGLGAPRVAQRVCELVDTTHLPMILRPATIDDALVMFNWQTDVSVRRFARNPTVPVWDEHVAWLSSKLGSSGCIFSIIEDEVGPAGLVRLDYLNNKNNQYEISIVVAPERQGKGLAKFGLCAIEEWVPGAPLVAEVHPDNLPSIRLFEELGYTRTDSRTFEKFAQI
jgi:UDP-2,4-diacetamido-2,4,6-trideoxy-beta-L-altropyranose hydrolase